MLHVAVAIFLLFGLFRQSDGVTVTLTSDPQEGCPGDPLTLTCNIDQDVSITGVTFRRNNVLTVLVFNTTSCVNLQPLPAGDTNTYTVSCDPSRRWFKVEIASVSENEYGVNWQCVITSSVTCKAVYPDPNPCIGNTFVYVQAPVKSVQLTNMAGSPLQSPVVVKESTGSTLQCTTGPEGSRPKAELTWWMIRNSGQPQQITTGVTPQPDSTTLSDTIITKSNLFINDRSYIGVSVYCRATVKSRVNESTQVTLDVRYRPTAGIRVEGQNTTLYIVTEGQRAVDFSCITVSANPAVTSVRWLHNSSTISGENSATYTINTIQKSDQGSYSCRLTNSEGPGDSSTVQLNVQYGPRISTFTSPHKEIEGRQLNIPCTATGIPVPDYEWTRTKPGLPENKQSMLTITGVSRSDADNYTCTATNTLTPTGGGQLQRSDRKAVVVDILYSPSAPTCRYMTVGITSSITVIRGDDVSITCDTDSNPAPTSNQYKWKEPASSGFQVKRTLTLDDIQVSRDGTYEFLVENTMINSGGDSEPGSNTSSIRINVLYPPRIPTLVYHYNSWTIPLTSDLSVIRGEPFTVSCQTDGNPSPSFTWTSGLTTVNDDTLPGDRVHSTGRYDCRATNIMNRVPVLQGQPVNPVQGSNNKSIAVTVLYGPTIKTCPLTKDVVEGSSLDVTCSADSHPLSMYKWTGPEFPSEPYRNDGRLNVPGILRSAAGTYTFHAKTTMMPTSPNGAYQVDRNASHNMEVVIRYFPDVTVSQSVRDSFYLELICMAHGVPENYDFYEWEHLPPGLTTPLRMLQGSTDRNQNVLTVSNVTYMDSGSYRCRVSNGITDFRTNETIASNTSQPKIFRSKPVVTNASDDATAQKGGNATLTVEFYSNHDSLVAVSVQWSQKVNNVWQNLTTEHSNITAVSVRLKMHTHLVQQPGFRTAIFLEEVQEEDFTDYRLEMRNDVAMEYIDISLRPVGQPETPKYLQTSTWTESSITLTWTPGFHSGADQTFILEYHKGNEPWTVAANVSGWRIQHRAFNETVSHLEAGTQYYFRISARNVYGDSPVSDSIQQYTNEAESDPNSGANIGAVAGGAAGGVLATMIIAGSLFLVLWLKRRRKGKPATEEEMHHVTTGSNSSAYQDLTARPQTTDYESLNTGMNYERVTHEDGQSAHTYQNTQSNYNSPYESLDTSCRQTDTYTELSAPYKSAGRKDIIYENTQI